MEKKYAFITGVSSGIGLALAKKLLAEGYQVYGMSRRRPSDLLESQQFHFESCDFKNIAKIPACVRALLRDVPRLDLVFLGAGMIGDLKLMTEASMEEIREIMNVNVWANKVLLDFLFTSSAPIDQVIGVSSGASQKGSKGWAGYSLSKATLNMLLKLYANEQPESHFTSLAPGLVLTDMLQGLLERKDADRFPSLNHLQGGKKFSPQQAAGYIFEKLNSLKEYESGAYVDMRDLVGEKSF